MKKLTAGIFATILGLTTVNAFAATAGTKVASTNYVDGAVAAANAYTDTKVGGIKVPSLDGYAKETWVEGKGYAVATKVAEDIATAKAAAISAAAEDAASKAATAKSEAIDAAATDATSKADAAEAAAIAAAASAADAKYAPQATTYSKTEVDTKISGIQTSVATNLEAYAKTADVEATYATKDALDGVKATADAAATKTAVSQLASQVSAHETSITANINSIDALNTEVAKKANSADVDASLELKADKTTTYTKTEVDSAIEAATYNDTEVRGLISGNATAISTLQTEQGTQNTAIAKAQADATQAINDAQAEQDVNIAQQTIIDLLPTTYVKVIDVVNEYKPATASN